MGRATKVTMWKTTDGMFHESYQLAMAHEERWEIKERLQTFLKQNQTEMTSSLTEALINHIARERSFAGMVEERKEA